jgi:acetylornithine deacetylase/succinyl-diaminopimelate desuccinylase-like protein
VQATIAVEMVRAPYCLDVTGSPVDDLSTAYRAVWGDDLPLGACSAPSDVPLFLGRGIPAVCHGPRPAGPASSDDEECVSVGDMARLAEVYARLSLSYLHRAPASTGAKHVSGDSKELSGKIVGGKADSRAAQGLTV